MSEKVVVTCSSGHRFPVNLAKNTHRDHVFCPRCRVEVTIRKKHIFSPSPNWKDEKERSRQDKREAKARSKPPDRTPAFQFPIEGFIPPFIAVKEMLKAKKEGEPKQE